MKKSSKIETPFGQASAIDTFYSMVSCAKWVKFLQGNGKPYQNFLSNLISVSFYKELDRRTTIKHMAEQFGFKRELITKWIKEMYEDIFDLNWNKPELFEEEGIMHELYFKGYRDSTGLRLWLKTTPRVYEKIDLFFLDAKLGCRSFWVKDVHHDLDDSQHIISVHLEGGILNKHRELLVDRALFEGVLGWMDAHQGRESAIDKQLLLFYKH
jgi:hypothetical protein